MDTEKRPSGRCDWSTRIAFGCVVGISSLACCCQILPDISVKRKLAREDVIGVWVPTDDTLALAEGEGVQGTAPPKLFIELKADGTCVYESISSEYDHLEYIKATGTWVLRHDPETQGGDSNEIRFVLQKPDGGHGFSMDFTDDYGELMMWTFHGDPDSWDLVKHRREKSPKSSRSARIEK